MMTDEEIEKMQKEIDEESPAIDPQTGMPAGQQPIDGTQQQGVDQTAQQPVIQDQQQTPQDQTQQSPQAFTPDLDAEVKKFTKKR